MRARQALGGGDSASRKRAGWGGAAGPHRGGGGGGAEEAPPRGEGPRRRRLWWSGWGKGERWSFGGRDGAPSARQPLPSGKRRGSRGALQPLGFFFPRFVGGAWLRPSGAASTARLGGKPPSPAPSPPSGGASSSGRPEGLRVPSVLRTAQFLREGRGLSRGSGGARGAGRRVTALPFASGSWGWAAGCAGLRQFVCAGTREPGLTVVSLQPRINAPSFLLKHARFGSKGF